MHAEMHACPQLLAWPLGGSKKMPELDLRL